MTSNISILQGSGSINVYGTFRKLGSFNSVSGISTFNILGGTIETQEGPLTIGGTGGVFENGNFNSVIGASLTINGAQYWKGTQTGSGGGTVSKTVGLVVDAAGATLNFPSGYFNLSGGMTIGGGVLSVAPGSFVGTIFGSKIINNQFDIYGTLVATNNSFNLVINNPGMVTVKSGGLLTSSGTNNSFGSGGAVGSTPGSLRDEGTIRVEANSSLAMVIPFDNVGTVDVQSGGSLSHSGAMAQRPGSALLGGTWNVSGSLNFSSGGAITTIGAGASVTLNGPSAIFSRIESSQLQNNQGQLTIRGGKSLGTFRQFTNSGTLTVEAGSSLTVPNTNPSPSFTQTGGSTVLAGGSIIAPVMTMSGGALTGTGTIITNITNSGGVVGPGASPGKINITGNYTQGAAGTLNIEVGGTNAATPDFDQLIVSGTATLDGTLNVSAINGFIPSKGETFRFLSAGSRSGDFAVKNLAPYQGYPLFGTNFGPNFYDLNSLNIIVRNTNDSGLYSFRQAIIDANIASDPDAILFNIPGTGPFTISPTSALPIITQPVTIDAYAQLGASPNTLAVGSNAVLKVELNGAGFSTGGFVSGNGLNIQASNTTVKGLVINRFSGNQVNILGPSATNVVLIGNYLGVNVAGNTPLRNASVRQFAAGVGIGGGAHDNRIGTDGNGVNDFAERNVISGNRWAGV